MFGRLSVHMKGLYMAFLCAQNQITRLIEDARILGRSRSYLCRNSMLSPCMAIPLFPKHIP